MTSQIHVSLSPYNSLIVLITEWSMYIFVDLILTLPKRWSKSVHQSDLISPYFYDRYNKFLANM